MGSPLTISQAADLVDVAIQNIWLKGTTEDREYFREFYNVTTGVDDYKMQDSSLSGLGSAARVTEQAAITQEVPVQGNNQTYTQIMYGEILPITWYMWKFGIKKRNLENIVGELKKACRTRREELLHEKLDAAQLSSYTTTDKSGNYSITTTGGDSVVLVSASHTREDGGSAWSNLVSDGVTDNLKLDYAGLKALWRVAALVKTPKGKPFDTNPTTIIVKRGTAAHFKALEIMGAIKAGKIPEEFSNDGSAIPMFKLIDTPYLLGTGNTVSTTDLSAATNWHAFDPNLLTDQYGLQYFESQGITLDEQNIVYSTKEIQYSATLVFDYGHNDARGFFGGSGVN